MILNVDCCLSKCTQLKNISVMNASNSHYVNTMDRKLYCEESWPRLRRGTHADQIWYLEIGLPNEAPIVAFLFIPAMLWSFTSHCHFILSKISLFWESDVGQTVRPALQTRVLQSRHHAWVITAVKVFLEWASSKIPVLQGPWRHRTTQPKVLIWQ